MADQRDFERALALGYGGKEEAAVQELRRLLETTAENEDKGWLILHEALFLGHLRRCAEARGKLGDLAKIWDDTSEHRARIAVVDAILDEGDFRSDQALRKMNNILVEYKNLWNQDGCRDLYMEIQFNRGRLLATAENYRLAILVLEESLEFERPKAGEFYYNLGFCYFQAERWDDAEKFLKQSLSLELLPAVSSAAHYYLANISYRRGAIANAQKQFENALDDAILAGTPLREIYDALAKSSKRLGLMDDSLRYESLAKSSG